MAAWHHGSGEGRWTETNVRAFASLNGEEEPNSFEFGGLRLDIVGILDRWSMGQHRYFKVKVVNRHMFLLRREGASGHWEASELSSKRY